MVFAFFQLGAESADSIGAVLNSKDEQREIAETYRSVEQFFLVTGQYCEMIVVLIYNPMYEVCCCNKHQNKDLRNTGSYCSSIRKYLFPE